jgi:hypothetical protein
MSEIKLYKKFYSVNSVQSGSTNVQYYTLYNPYALTASTYVAGTADSESTTEIELNVPISQESNGVYYANLNPTLYSSDVTYDLVWFVNYTDVAPQKKVSTRFRLNANKISNQIEVEIINNPIQIEISNNSTEIEIL